MTWLYEIGKWKLLLIIREYGTVPKALESYKTIRNRKNMDPEN